jgi:zinc protease
LYTLQLRTKDKENVRRVGENMLWGFLILFLFGNPVEAETITVYGKKIPEAEYKLKLDQYNLELTDYRFPSGLRILFQSEKTQPIVAITTAIDRGSEYDQEDMDGIAHVVEHLAFRANHGGIKNWDLISQMGGTINASTSVDWTNYMTIAPRDALVPLLRLEALRMQNGVKNVTEQDVVTETEIARNEMRMRYENAAVSAAMEIIGAQLYPEGHPYSRSTIGTHETLGNINLEKVQEYVKDNYRPEYITIVVVGDFELKDAGNLIFDAFEGAEELLMAPEDAAKFITITTEQERIKFLNEWFPQMIEYMNENSQNEYPARIDCSNRAEPPLPTTQDIVTIQGMTDRTTAVLAWSLPGGYCDDQPTMQMASSLLTNYIYRHIVPDWEFQKEESSISGIGCFLNPEEYYSTLLCFVEQGQGGYTADKLVEKVGDSLYLQTQQYDPNMVNSFEQWNFNYARSQGMASLLQSVDSVSDLFSGRATATAMFTHFTGDPRYFTANMNAINQVTPEATKDVARKYITRDRMVAVIVEPMDQEEKERREAAAHKDSRSSEVKEYHAAKDEDRYKSLYDADKVTQEMLEAQLVSPDLAGLRRFTLDNGLTVGILPYGDAPLVRVGLRVKGDMRTAEPLGLNSMAEYALGIGDKSQEDILAVAGYIAGTDTSMTVAGSSGNLDALLNKLRWMVEPSNHDWVSSTYRKKQADSWASGVKSNSDDPNVWASRYMYETLLPDHPMGYWMRPEDYLLMKDWDLDLLQGWMYNKWQPSNAELLIVGRVDPKLAEEQVRKFFENWNYNGDAEASNIGFMSKPLQTPERTVYVFDKPTATQSQISLKCQVNTNDHLDDRARAQVVGDVLSQMAWRKLREEAGVTYGASAYIQVWQGGTGVLSFSSLVQNDATGFAVETIFDIIAKGAKGEVNEQSIADAKLSRAREYVLYQQSGDQMLSRLLGTGMDNFNFFNEYSSNLANVNTVDFTNLLSNCEGREVVSIVGPISDIEGQLTEKNITYTTIDWEAERRNLLTEKERKKEDKKKKKAEKKRQREEAKNNK